MKELKSYKTDHVNIDNDDMMIMWLISLVSIYDKSVSRGVDHHSHMQGQLNSIKNIHRFCSWELLWCRPFYARTSGVSAFNTPAAQEPMKVKRHWAFSASATWRWSSEKLQKAESDSKEEMTCIFEYCSILYIDSHILVDNKLSALGIKKTKHAFKKKCWSLVSEQNKNSWLSACLSSSIPSKWPLLANHQGWAWLQYFP